jgi:type IV pilus assembly protein PilW
MTSHSQFLLSRPDRPSQSGFTLVELMVGLAIGMLATLVVMQVFSVFEVQKRTTTGTADAQTNGNIALYQVTRDLQVAGYGLEPIGLAGTPDSALECATVINGADAAASGVISISPVTIVEGGNNSDTITIRYGNTLNGGIPTKITAAVVATPTNDVSVASNLACEGNDVVLVINGANCALTRVSSGVQAVKTLSFYDDRAITAGIAALDARVSCLGFWSEVTYSVANGNLMRGAEPVVAGIVSIQAQYGISAVANDNQIIDWVDATGVTWANPTVANRNRIKAVRIAIVARNATREPNVVTEACSSRVDPDPSGLCAWDATTTPQNSQAPLINLGASNADFGHYRYKVFETIIPLRNVIWSKSTL